jgi:hypothetical protein
MFLTVVVNQVTNKASVVYQNSSAQLVQLTVAILNAGFNKMWTAQRSKIQRLLQLQTAPPAS